MRFRKSIRLCKGVKLNLSKSGVSLSTGIKGLSLTTSKKGVWLNTSLPGTGLYDRKKIASFGGKKKETKKATKATKASEPEPEREPGRLFRWWRSSHCPAKLCRCSSYRCSRSSNGG